MKITPDRNKLRYSGRIDFSDPKAPLMVFPCSFVTFRFTGDILRVTVENRNAYWKNYIGYMLDGQQHTVALEMNGRQTIEIPVADTGCTEHECMIFKRMDACHYLIIHELELADSAQLLDPPPAHSRRIEVYGDSVSAGEVIIAVGQNDNHPDDYMAREPKGEKALYWKVHYDMFVRNIRRKYPDATIILATTILNHDAHWDEAIDEVCRHIASPKVHHFLYSNNGKGTPGHVRAREAEQMAEELSAFIESLGAEIWE